MFLPSAMISLLFDDCNAISTMSEAQRVVLEGLKLHFTLQPMSTTLDKQDFKLSVPAGVGTVELP